MLSRLTHRYIYQATDLGRSLYEKFGFRTLMKIAFSPERKNPSQEWKRMTSEMGKFHLYLTWRPYNGFKDGKPQAPWQVDQWLASEGRIEVRMPAITHFSKRATPDVELIRKMTELL